MNPFVYRTTLAILFVLASFSSNSEDLGAKAQAYKTDPSGADQLRELARKKQQSPEVARFWEDYRAKTLEAIKHPQPLGIPTSLQSRTEMRDLRFQFQSDFRDEKGRVLVPRGTVVEPLKIKPMMFKMLFIDGRDQSQIDYAIKRGNEFPLKIILTAGSPLELRQRYKDTPWLGARGVPFYFDQRKMIISSLDSLYGIHLSSVPVELAQEGTRMKVSFGFTQ